MEICSFREEVVVLKTGARAAGQRRGLVSLPSARARARAGHRLAPASARRSNSPPDHPQSIRIRRQLCGDLGLECVCLASAVSLTPRGRVVRRRDAQAAAARRDASDQGEEKQRPPCWVLSTRKPLGRIVDLDDVERKRASCLFRQNVASASRGEDATIPPLSLGIPGKHVLK